MMGSRHDLLELHDTGWSALFARRPDLAAVPSLRQWAGRAWPVIRRRGAAATDADDARDVPVAVTLPLAAGRSRLGFAVRADDVRACRPPPTLAEAASGALAGRLPDHWRDISASIVRVGAATGLVPRLFGSAMWQCATGLAYLRPGSDLDILWRVPALCADVALRPILADEGGVLAAADPRVDGEVAIDGVGGVAWRELVAAGRGDALLVKSDTVVFLLRKAAFLGGGAA